MFARTFCPDHYTNQRSVRACVDSVCCGTFREGARSLSPIFLSDMTNNSLSFVTHCLDLPMSKTRGKHKRGAHGSMEEGDSALKRANMAASKDPEDITSGDEESETKDKPIRAELKSMLVDIQVSISSILLENKQTRKGMAQLKETVLEQKAEIASLKAT